MGIVLCVHQLRDKLCFRFVLTLKIQETNKCVGSVPASISREPSLLFQSVVPMAYVSGICVLGRGNAARPSDWPQGWHDYCSMCLQRRTFFYIILPVWFGSKHEYHFGHSCMALAAIFVWHFYNISSQLLGTARFWSFGAFSGHYRQLLLLSVHCLVIFLVFSHSFRLFSSHFAPVLQ